MILSHEVHTVRDVMLVQNTATQEQEYAAGVEASADERSRVFNDAQASFVEMGMGGGAQATARVEAHADATAAVTAVANASAASGLIEAASTKGDGPRLASVEDTKPDCGYLDYKDVDPAKTCEKDKEKYKKCQQCQDIRCKGWFIAGDVDGHVQACISGFQLLKDCDECKHVKKYKENAAAAKIQRALGPNGMKSRTQNKAFRKMQKVAHTALKKSEAEEIAKLDSEGKATYLQGRGFDMSHKDAFHMAQQK